MHSDELPLESAPQWSLALGEAGRWMVFVAVGLFLLSAIVWYLSKKFPQLATAGKFLFASGCFSVIGSFASLAVLFVENRFEYEYVWAHSELSNPFPYRIAAVWSGQEGSFLLWAVCAALFGVWAVWKLGALQRWYSIAYSLFLGGIMAILAYESPFKMILLEGRAVSPLDGKGLAPSLQNYWVIIHPPVIFLGFAMLTVLFTIGLAALIERKYDEWLPLVRPWAISTVAVLGLGLCMGGFWAYETLGWGGFWMWDPVENVSFVPWCITAALVHGLIVQSTKGKWKIANLLLAGLPFLTFVYGTFLTRSGLLADASVHSFAEMDRSALRLLIGILAAAVLGFFVPWVVRWRQFAKTQEPKLKGLHREGFYSYGVILLTSLGLATLIGMSVPFFMALQGKAPKIVEEKAYHMVLPWVFVPLMLVMAVTPFLSWRGSPAKEFGRKVYSIVCVATGITGLSFLGIAMSPLRTLFDLTGKVDFPMGLKVPALAWVLFLFWICIFVVTASIWRIKELSKGSKLGWAPLLTHAGVAILMAGLILSRGFERKEETIAFAGSPGKFLSYAVRVDGMTSTTDDKHNQVKLTVYDPHKKGEEMFVATPGLYFVNGPNGEQNPMVWPHVQRYPFYDIYITLHPPQTDLTEPMAFKVGETKNVNGLLIQYKGLTRKGEAGMAGTSFGADLVVQNGDQKKNISPSLKLGDRGAEPVPEFIDDKLQIALVSMNAGSKEVQLQLKLATPMFPIEVYVKPFTGFVWGGTGLMTLGGLLSAYYRRVAKKAVQPEVVPGEDFERGKKAALSI